LTQFLFISIFFFEIVISFTFTGSFKRKKAKCVVSFLQNSELISGPEHLRVQAGDEGGGAGHLGHGPRPVLQVSIL
jgi:hypothetical protein